LVKGYLISNTYEDYLELFIKPLESQPQLGVDSRIL